MLSVTNIWRETYPGAVIGILAMGGVSSPSRSPELEQRKAGLEDELRRRFAGQDRAALLENPILRAYRNYYKRFRKTYHVQLQLESVLLQGKSLPGGAALVEALFMEELNNLLLTAGQDLETLRPPLSLSVAAGSEHLVMLNGQDQALKPGDMVMLDSQGAVCSVLYGIDRRTRLTPRTRQALATIYAPAGIKVEAVRNHLQDIQELVRLFSSELEILALEVYQA